MLLPARLHLSYLRWRLVQKADNILFNYITIISPTVSKGLSGRGQASEAERVPASCRVRSGSVSKHTDCTNELMHCSSAEPAEPHRSFCHIYILHLDIIYFYIPSHTEARSFSLPRNPPPHPTPTSFSGRRSPSCFPSLASGT